MILLENRSLLKVSGNDAESFLHSQFSNDIRHIDEKKVQINAYCQHQGKVIVIPWVIKKRDSYYLSIPSEMKDIVLSKLNMFKLMSQVDIEDFSKKIYQYGLIGESNTKSYQICDDLSLLTSREVLTDYHNNSLWEIECIKKILPEVYASISEKHIPQSFNLDINQFGVSFTKGCYPGQEVVARMHYLGNPKRRLFHFTSKFEAFVGDTLNVNDSRSLKSSGQVIRVAKDDNKFHFLAVFKAGQINNHIFLNNDQSKIVNLVHE